MATSIKFPLPKQFTEYDLTVKPDIAHPEFAGDLSANTPNYQRVLFDQMRETYPPQLIQAISFLADHFLDDIRFSQLGPYEYTDTERDMTAAVLDWANDLCERMGVTPIVLDHGKATYHQADAICDEQGEDREPWPNQNQEDKE